MHKSEFLRLLSYARASRIARQHRPSANQQGRRNVKGRAKGVGQVLKDSRVLTMKQI